LSHDLITAEAYNQLPAVAPDHTFRYGAAPDHYADLYLPQQAGQHPVIVLIHGGCWRAMYTAKPLGGLCRALTEMGFAVWNLEYRRNGTGGGWINTFLDVAHGTDYLRQIADRFNLNLAKVFTMGHSAGGHLAMWVAARPRLPISSPLYTAQPLPVQGVVALAGILDLERAVEQAMCGDSLTQIMGGVPADVPDHYQQGSPMALLPIGVRQIHVVGERDTEILANLRPFVAAAQNAGDDVELTLVPDVGHFEIVIATTPAWKIVQQAITTFAAKSP
jgi:acetyl esterase/lipase